MMVPVVVARQVNEDGSMTFAYRDDESRKVVVCTGTPPLVRNVEVTTPDKLVEVLKSKKVRD